MSQSLARLRKRAAEFEQKKQFDRALEVYVQILDEGGKDLDDEDVPLFNRVGDMLMRKGSVTEALGYYERAVDMYAERGYLNNAIALCSKILRQSPGRAAVYYKLARISARKGFKSDARKNFLEYADRMQKLGMADEAFRALKEFASLYPDQDDVRLVLAELLSKENRKGEALEQLQSLYEKLQSEGRSVEARATIDRMRAIDPSVTPREGSRTPPPAVGDLVFLDLTDSDASPPSPRPQPASARAPMPTPVPALTGLSITFFPEQADAPHPEGFEATAVESTPVESPKIEPRSIPTEPDTGPDETPPPVGASGNAAPAELDQETVGPAAFELADESDNLARVEDALNDLDLEPSVAVPDESAPETLTLTPMSGVEFGDLDLDLDEPAREAASRRHDLALPGELPPLSRAGTPAFSLVSDAASEDARAAAEEAADLAADFAVREAALQGPASGTTPSTPSMPSAPQATGEEPPGLDDPVPPFAPPEPVIEAPAVEEQVPDDFLSVPPKFGPASASGEEHAFPPLFGMAETPESAAPVTDDAPDEVTLDLPGDEHEVGNDEPAPAPARGTPRATISIGSAESHLRRRLELEPENWELRRQLGEALLDAGDRDGGLYELELAMAGFELAGNLDRANEVVDEILAVSPASIGHHQKRVEFAVKSRDRSRLTHAYLELADALFRNGAGAKAVAVYGRVLELAPENERAEFALATLAPAELDRLRGGSRRPERWTDELAAIDRARPAATGTATAPDEASPAPTGLAPEGEDGLARTEAATMPDEAAVPDEDHGSPAGGRTHGRTSAAPATGSGTPTPVADIELPHPDWDEGVPLAAPATDAGEVEPVSDASSREEAFTSPTDDVDVTAAETSPATDVVESDVVEGGSVVEDPDTLPDDAVVAQLPDPAPSAASEPQHDVAAGSANQASPRAPAPASVPSRGEATPPGVAEVWAIPEPSTPGTPDAAPEPTFANHPASRPPTPSSVSAPPDTTPANLPRWSTPAAAEPPATPAYSHTPSAGLDSELVDLGEWLRQTEPTRSTRMQVEDPKPTGDEQADFEELLRRFKRGVAENVEAEDYEAHYDLGVAYKEMGLVDEAIAQFQKALRGPANRVRTYEALGQCFVEKEQFPIAAALLQRATEVPGTDDQQLVGVLYLLGYAMEHMGRPGEAMPYYLRVFAVDIEFRDIAERVAAMGNLTK